MRPFPKRPEHLKPGLRISYQEGLATRRVWLAEHIEPMNKSRAAVLSGVFLLTALATYALPAVAAETATFDRSFTLTAPVRIGFRNASGNVEVRGSAAGRGNVNR